MDAKCQGDCTDWALDQLKGGETLDQLIELLLACVDPWWTIPMLQAHLELLKELIQIKDGKYHLPHSPSNNHQVRMRALLRTLGRMKGRGVIAIRGTKVGLLARVARRVEVKVLEWPRAAAASLLGT